MISPVLALVLASGASTLSVTVVSLDFSYPYFGEPGNTCQRGSVYVRALGSPDGTERKPLVVRMVDSAGLTPGAEAVLDDVRRAGTGRDGTPVFCAAGRVQAGAPAPVADASTTQPPLVAAEGTTPATQPVATQSTATATQPAERQPTASACTARLFHVIKKPLGEKKFGPSEFDPESAQGAAEPVDCALARSRVSNVLLVRMVKDGHSNPEAVVGAEWGPGSTWQREPDAPQRRVVKVYFAEAPTEPSAQR